jgi:membrane-bound metal-dependent hydrolase YbcI (DUF457 family)
LLRLSSSQLQDGLTTLLNWLDYLASLLAHGLLVVLLGYFVHHLAQYWAIYNMGDLITDADYVLVFMLCLCFFGPLVIAAILLWH